VSAFAAVEGGARRRVSELHGVVFATLAAPRLSRPRPGVSVEYAHGLVAAAAARDSACSLHNAESKESNGATI